MKLFKPEFAKTKYERKNKLCFRFSIFIGITLMLGIVHNGNAQTSYIPGKLAVLIVGDGTAALSGAATPVFVKEFNIAGAVQTGTLRTTLPTTATTGLTSVNRALTQSGSSTAEGYIGLSTDRQSLLVTGYNSSSGLVTVSNSVATTFPTNTRVIAKIDATGVADTKTTLNTSFSGVAIRSATTVDGTAYWTAGANGMNYVLHGNIATPISISDKNTRVTSIFNSQLYTSSGASGLRLATVGSGLPTTASQTLTNLNGFLTTTGDPYSFVFIDLNGGGPDLLYVASLNSAPAGLLKYKSIDNGTTWTAAGSLTGNAFGVTGVFNTCSGNVDLYITLSSGGGVKPTTLYKITDNGAGVSTLSGAINSGILLATAAANTAFGGVAFTPGTVLTAPAMYSVTGGNTCFGSSVTVATSNSDLGINYELKKDGVTVSILPGTGTAISFGSQSAAGVYTIVATNPLTGCTTNMSGSSVINPLPTVSFSGLSSQYCLTSSTVMLTGSPAGGAFSGPGIIDNGNGTASFNPATAGVGGPYIIMYSYTDISTSCSKNISQTASVKPLPTASLSVSANSICIGGTSNLVLDFTGTGPWNYSINGGSTVMTSNDPETVSVTPSTTTTYKLTSLSDANCTVDEWKSISTGSYHSIAIKADGTLWAWGYNFYGQLGDGTNSNKNKPVQIGTSSDWASIATGSVHSFAIKNDGTLWVWGGNSWGQLGLGDYTDRNLPVQLGTANDWAKIDGGHVYSFAIKTNGTLWGWGANYGGFLGNGNNTNTNLPGQIGVSTDWASISGGEVHSMAIKTDGTLWGWGQNTYGEIGTGGAGGNSPLQVGTATDWVQVFAGQYYSLGIKAGGTLWAWGRNTLGELGNGNNSQVNTPVQIGLATNWSRVTGHSSHSLGLKQDGTLWSWGLNNKGQLGNGTTTSTNFPIQVGTETNWTGITAGLNNSHGMKNGGGIWSWGINNYGQLGDESNIDKNTPVKVMTVISSVTVTVNPLPAVSFSGLSGSYCVNTAAVNLTGSPAGGTFSGPGISGNVFNPALAGAGGPYTITYTYTGSGPGCVNSSSQTVSVISLPVVSFSGLASQYCVNASAVTLIGSNGGGTFSGPGITDNSDGTATFSPAAAGVGGPYAIVFSFLNTETGCGNTYTQQVTVNPLPSVSISGNNFVCFGGTTLLTATATPGSGSIVNYQWVVTTLSGATNLGIAATQAINSGGDFTVIVTNTNGCTASSSVFSVTAYAEPTLSISGLASQYCVNATAVTLNGYLFGNQAMGGSFSGPGIIDNGNGTAFFNPATAGAGGPYSIIYSYTFPGTTCSNSISQTVTVNALPVISFSGMASQYCITSSAVTLTGSPAGGTFSGPGITGNTFSPATAGTGGPYTITYAYTNIASGCSNSVSQNVTVKALPTAGVSATPNSVCVGSTANITLNFTGTGPWSYSLNGAAPVSTSSNPEIVPVNPIVTTVYKLTSLSDANCISNEWVSFSADYGDSHGIKAGGTLWGWGSNSNAEIGNGNNTDTNVPVQIGATSNWAKISSGQLFSLAIKKDGTLWAWGINNYGQLGDGTNTNRNSPVQIGSSSDWSSVFCTPAHTLAIKTNGTLWAWGLNNNGQLGDGTINDKNSPVQIGSSTDWADVSGGTYFSLGIKTNGTIWAWGASFNGQLGGGTNSIIPVQRGISTDWAKISAGDSYSLAIKTNGTLWAWGYNGNGQLGDGTVIDKNSPVQIGSATNWAGISAARFHSLGIRQDGTLWAWGLNDNGQLGDGSNINKNSPVQIGISANWSKIMAGYLHSLGIKTDGTLWAWGDNFYGQLGDGTNTDKNTPAQIIQSVPSVTINVNPLPVVSFSGLASNYCVNASPVTLTGTPAGGIFSGPGISGNVFNPAVAGAGGSYTISYSYNNIATGCSNNSSQSVFVNALPVVSFSGLASQYCINASPVNLTGSHAAGIFSGPGISGSTFNPALAGIGGPYTITYSFTNILTGCSNTVSQLVSVGALPSVSISGNNFVCSGGSALLTATAAAGSGTISSYQWVRTTLAGSTNLGTAATQSINAGGDYTVIVTNSFGCAITSGVFNVTSYAVPSISFSGLASPYCANAPAVTLNAYLFGNPAQGGTFSGPGITDNGNGTAIFNPATAGAGGPYTIIYTYAYPGTTCSNSVSQTVTVNTLPVVNFIGLAGSYCTTDATVTLTGAPAGGAFSGPGIVGNTFVPSLAGAGSHSITYTYSNGTCSNSSVQQVTVNVCITTITVNLKLFLQGYYIDGGIMQPVLNNQAVANSLSTETDSITVELHDPTNFALVDSKMAVLSTNGFVSATFTQPAGSYYIAIKHRNTIQTWSTDPQACLFSTPLYDFTTAANKAMGDVQVEVQTGKWAFYTGDLNQDDFIDGNDFPAFDTDIFFGVNSVYVATDMNGDGFVDGNDFPVFDVNSFNGVSAVHP